MLNPPTRSGSGTLERIGRVRISEPSRRGPNAGNIVGIGVHTENVEVIAVAKEAFSLTGCLP